MESAPEAEEPSGSEGEGEGAVDQEEVEEQGGACSRGERGGEGQRGGEAAAVEEVGVVLPGQVAADVDRLMGVAHRRVRDDKAPVRKVRGLRRLWCG